MTGDQYKRIIARLDLSQVKAAQLMGYSPRAYAAWESGDSPLQHINEIARNPVYWAADDRQI